MRFLLVNLYAAAWVTITTIRARRLLRCEAKHARGARRARAAFERMAESTVPRIAALVDRAERERDMHTSAEGTQL